MRAPRIGKVVLHICTGESGDKLIRAEKLLGMLTGGRKSTRTMSTCKIPTWGLKKGELIGCKVTLRGAEAEEFLKKALEAKGGSLKASSFDKYGNFGFGITEYIDIKGMKYDPEIGVFGFDVIVSMERPGYRVKQRNLRKNKVGKKHLLNKDDSIEYIKEKFNINVTK